MTIKKNDFIHLIDESFVQNVFFTLEKRKKRDSSIYINQKGQIKQLNTKRIECYPDFRPTSKII